MNLNVLNGERMLVLSRYWMNNPDAKDALDSHEMGPPLRNQLSIAYTDVRRVDLRRRQVEKKLKDLSERMKALNQKHARLTRALQGYFIGLASAAEDKDDAEWYVDTRETLLPLGLKVINKSYEHKAGMVEQIQEALTDDMMERLETIVVGGHTLATLVREWLDAARELGERMIERDRVESSLKGKALRENKLGIREVRGSWMRAVKMIVMAVGMMKLQKKQRDALIQPLECMIAKSIREQRGVPAEGSDGAGGAPQASESLDAYDIENMAEYANPEDEDDLEDVLYDPARVLQQV